MQPITIKGRIEFINKHFSVFDRYFTATLQDTPATKYGNKTAVVITYGPMESGVTPEPQLLDTRYDTTIRKDKLNFKRWLEEYFDATLEKHRIIIYSMD